jgi:hypothetical protein
VAVDDGAIGAELAVVTGVVLVVVVLVEVLSLSPPPLSLHATVNVLSAITAAAPAATRTCRETRLAVMVPPIFCVLVPESCSMRSTRSAPIPSTICATT